MAADDISPVSEKSKASLSGSAADGRPHEQGENYAPRIVTNTGHSQKALGWDHSHAFDNEKSAITTTVASPSSPVGRRILTEEDGYKALGFSFPGWKKWAILTSIFIVQISMNFNAAVYMNAVPGMREHFQISAFTAKLGQFIFLVTYAFGCELWAPWSEELGRKWVLQGSLFFVNVWQIGAALAPNFWVVFAMRFLGGLSSAGGSVTLGMVADMWEPAWQQYAVAYVVLSSVAGSVVGPIFGGIIQHYLSWRWVFWIQLILGVAAQAIHFFVPETRATILLDKEAKRRRKTGQDVNIWGPNEVHGSIWKRISFKDSAKLMWRPYQFLLCEPIVTFLSLLSGFSDALIFTGLESFGLVLEKWHFSVMAKGFSFIPLLLSYFIAYAAFLPVYRKDRRVMNGNVNAMVPERRLWFLCWLVPLETIGLFAFAWCSIGPPHVHWIAPLIFTVLIGIANFAIYMATIDYMVAAYGEYSASATGGNGFCRDLLAGIAALYASPFYENIAHGTQWQLVIPTLILSGVALLLAIPVYVFYIKGAYFRKNSKYASDLALKRADNQERREDAISRATTPMASRIGTPAASRMGSRANSPTRNPYHLTDRARAFGIEDRPVSRTSSVRRVPRTIVEMEEGDAEGLGRQSSVRSAN